jgi:hypothetical protein
MRKGLALGAGIALVTVHLLDRAPPLSRTPSSISLLHLNPHDEDIVILKFGRHMPILDSLCRLVLHGKAIFMISQMGYKLVHLKEETEKL